MRLRPKVKELLPKIAEAIISIEIESLERREVCRCTALAGHGEEVRSHLLWRGRHSLQRSGKHCPGKQRYAVGKA